MNNNEPVGAIFNIQMMSGWGSFVLRMSAETMPLSLAVQFPSDDVHIFVSTISYGADQLALRKLVEHELLSVVSDPQIIKERVPGELLFRLPQDM